MKSRALLLTGPLVSWVRGSGRPVSCEVGELLRTTPEPATELSMAGLRLSC